MQYWGMTLNAVVYCSFLRKFGEAHYGFALPTNSPYTAPLSIEMLELRNKGEISKIIDKWMIDRTPCKALDEDDATGKLILVNMITLCGRKKRIIWSRPLLSFPRYRKGIVLA